MGKKASAATPAIAALRAAGIEHRVHTYAHDPRAHSYGAEAAEAMDIDAARVFKTLVIAAGGDLAVAVVPVARKLNLKAAGAALGLHRPALADPNDVRRVTGYVLGGVSPLGQRRKLPTALDDSALGLASIFCSAGRRGMEIELAPTDLVRATGAITAALAAR